MVIMIPNVYQGADVDLDFKPDPEMLRKMGKFNDEMAEAGVMLSAEGLRPRAAGARLSFATGSPKLIDGPSIKSPEVFGGYWMLEADSQEEVIEWMKKCPAEKGDVIEIRQVEEEEDFEIDE